MNAHHFIYDSRFRREYLDELVEEDSSNKILEQQLSQMMRLLKTFFTSSISVSTYVMKASIELNDTRFMFLVQMYLTKEDNKEDWFNVSDQGFASATRGVTFLVTLSTWHSFLLDGPPVQLQEVNIGRAEMPWWDSHGDSLVCRKGTQRHSVEQIEKFDTYTEPL